MFRREPRAELVPVSWFVQEVTDDTVRENSGKDHVGSFRDLDVSHKEKEARMRLTSPGIGAIQDPVHPVVSANPLCGEVREESRKMMSFIDWRLKQDVHRAHL